MSTPVHRWTCGMLPSTGSPGIRGGGSTAKSRGLIPSLFRRAIALGHGNRAIALVTEVLRAA
jgi:hypothetical protein